MLTAHILHLSEKILYTFTTELNKVAIHLFQFFQPAGDSLTRPSKYDVNVEFIWKQLVGHCEATEQRLAQAIIIIIIGNSHCSDSATEWSLFISFKSSSENDCDSNIVSSFMYNHNNNTVKPPIKDTLNKGHSRSIKDIL